MKYTKRMLAFLLAVCMVFTSVQLPVNAEEDSVIETVAKDLTVEEPADEDVVVEDAESDDSAAETGEEESVEEEAAVEERTEEDAAANDLEKEEAVVEEESSDDETIEEIVEELVAVEENVSYAAENGKEVVDAAVFFSDLHAMKSGDSTTGSYGYKKDIVTNMMTALKNTGLTFSSVTSVGDAFSSNETAYTGKTSIITGYIRDALENATIPVNYTWSDHDRAALAENDKDLLENKSGLIYGAGNDGIYGNEDDGNYYIYAISMSDTSSSERYNQPSTFTTQKLQDFKDAVNVLDNTKPLFIASHQPLLARRSDNQYAYQWCTAINEIAEKRDVAFFFGHNHKYDQSGDYYYEKGSTMSVQDGSSTKPVELNFTHMCAGYFDPSTTGSAGSSRQGTVMLVTMYDDEINYTTYCASGEYTSSYAVNETVPRDHVAKTVAFEDNILTIKATALGVTAINAENVTGEYGLDDCFTDHIAYDVELEGLTDGNEVFYSILFLDDMDDTAIELYHVDDEGNMFAIPYEMVTDELGRRYLEFTTTYAGVFAYGAPGIPEGYTLSELKVSNIEKTKYFVDDSLDLVSPIVTAVYSQEGSEDFTRIVDIKDDYVTTDGYTVSGYDMAKAGKQTVVISYGELTCSFDIEVFAKTFRDETTSVSIELTVPGVTGLDVTESANQYVESALKGLVKEGTFVAYDIEVSDHKIGDIVTVTMPIPEGIENPVVYYVSDSGKTAKNMNATDNGDGTISFETNHFSTYVLADGTTIELEKGNATVEGTEDTIITTKDVTQHTVYKLVSTPVSGRQYLIVSSNTGNGYGLDRDTTGYATAAFAGGEEYYSSWDDASQTGTQLAEGTYLTTNSAYLWTAGNNTFTINYNKTGNKYYKYSLNPSGNESGSWKISNNKLLISLRNRKNNSATTDYYLSFNRTTWSMNTSGTNVYFYEPIKIYKVTETTVVIPGEQGHTYSVEGTNITDAVAIANEKVILSSVLLDTTTSGTQTDITENPEWTVTYEVVTTKGNPNVIAKDKAGHYLINGNTATLSGTLGTAVIRATYISGDLTAWDEFVVTTDYPDHYSIQLHKADLTEVNITEFASGDTYYTYNSETNTYKIADNYVGGTTYYTTPVIKGDEITETVALKGVKAGDTYSVWAVVKAYASETDTDGVELGTLGDELSWSVSDTSIANINTETGVITFTGNNYGTFDVTVSYEGAGEGVIIDTITISVTDSLYVVPGDGTDDFPEYPNEGSVRFDKTAEAVGNFSETGIAKVEISMTGVPYTKGNRMDVVLMLDRSSSMDKAEIDRIGITKGATEAFIRNIVINEDGSFNDNRIIIADFLGGNLAQGSQHAFESNTYTLNEEKGYQIINNEAELEALLSRINEGFEGQQNLYGTEYAKGLKVCREALLASASDGNKQFCVFMSDGIPNYYQGETTLYESTKNIVGMFSADGAVTSSEVKISRNSNAYQYEKYSSLMKSEGVTVFTVGLGLLDTNSSWTENSRKASKEACEQVGNYLLNDIAGPAGEKIEDRDKTDSVSKLDEYFFSVADTDAASKMENVFANIALKILDAAKDVVVKDMVGNNYSVNFALPGEGENKITAEKTDGISEFYIQAVEYQLNADKERTGEPKILENFSFNSDGTFKSHTVNDAACSKCNHVTFNDKGEITVINGTYFDYESKEVGECTEEYLTWENEKIGATELALQYFAHLDDSSESVGTADEIPAGTYYTNEYATLTYTNYQGNRVQEEFPVPQMTWNGAQVSYVFYLVNEAGKPVNRAGREVPFAEAVYVTDVQTHHVIWNDLEQSSSLEAGYLAKDLVPDVYALYDDDASYNIHVYEDENKVNLNNHFVISGDVDDEEYNNQENRQWRNPKTTYVFNNKSDAIKYNETKAYIANDGKDTITSNSYLCKGEGTVTATIDEATTVTEKNFAEKPYFTYIDGKYTLAASYKSGVTYYEISSASYTSAVGETQWKPGENDSTSGGTVLNDGYVYYIDESNQVYTIVQKKNGNEVREGFDFHNTTVAFAVVWKPQLAEDTVVIDYGLDAVVDVIKNDVLAAGVVGVRKDAPSGTAINTGTYTAAKETSADIYINANNGTNGLKIGTASVENMNAVRFSLDKTNGMQFNEPAVFYYETDVNYHNSENKVEKTSMYSSVTVIPATTIYYEDCFVSYEHGYGASDKSPTGTPGKWEVVGNVNTSATQDEDRPGKSKIAADLDADNIYGYDSAYADCRTFSLGSAYKVNLNKKTTGNWPSATFTFTGTGFDIISQTSNTTGTIAVTVTGDALETPYNWIVDTYYGYTAKSNGFIEYTFTFGDDGIWHLTNRKGVEAAGKNGIKKDSPERGDTVVVYEENIEWTKTTGENALYQIPIIKSPELTYGTYTVTITPRFSTAFNHTANDNYDFYLDAIRIYSPANDGIVQTGNGSVDKTVYDAYKADGELYPEFIELRKELLEEKVFATEASSKTGAVFIDGFGTGGTFSQYQKYGPNNEIYLQNGQAVAFVLETDNYSLVNREHLGVKSPNGGAVNVKVSALAANGTVKTSQNITTSSASEQYFDVSECISWTPTGTNDGGNSDIILIENVGSAMVSLTNLKVTYKVADAAPALLMMNADAAATAVSYMSARYIGSIETAGKPEVLSVTTDKSAYAVSEPIQVSVKTNADAEYVTINGEKITEYVTEGSSRIWTYSATASENEQDEFAVVAYNKLDEVSEVVSKTVDIKMFAPETFKLELNKSKIVAGEKVKAKVTTSKNVKYVIVNGKKITKYTTDKAKTLKYWTYEVKVTKIGTELFEVVAYDAKGNDSVSITESVESIRFAPETFELELNKSKMIVGDKVKAKATTSKNVKYVTVNGKKITKYTTNKAKTLKYWTYEVKVTQAGIKDFETIAYNSNGSASESISKSVEAIKFEPETFDLALNKDDVIVGEKVKAKVTTSKNVKYVTVNGKKITKYTTDKAKTLKYWTYEAKAAKVGTMTFEAIAYNANGGASESILKSIEAARFTPETFEFELNQSKVVIGEKVKAKVTTSNTVKYVTVNGKKITKYTTDEAKTLKYWVYEAKMSKVETKIFKAVAYNTNGSASESISKSVEVTKFEPETFELTVNEMTVNKGSKYIVTVTASDDVKYVKVNGKKITKFTYDDEQSLKVFNVTYTATSVGKKNVKAVVYNKNGVASNGKTVIVTVQNK